MPFTHKYPYTDMHELNIDWLLERITTYEQTVKDLQDEFAKIHIVSEEYIQQMIDRAIAAEDYEVINKLEQLKQQLTSEYKTYVSQQINSLKNYVDIQDNIGINISKSYTDSAEARAKLYTDDKLINYTYMYSPITGEYMDVRDVVNQMVTYFHSQNALMASEYDVMELTASAYDAEQLTAYDYDFNGKNLLP